MRLVRSVLAVVTAALLMGEAAAVQLEGANKDAVKLDRGAYWNLEAIESGNTEYKLRARLGKDLSPSNYGIVAVGSNTYEQKSNLTLTQGACNTLWGSTTNRDVHLYAGYADSQATSTSASSPSTDITGLTSPSFKVAVDKNPVVTVTLDVTDNDTGAEVAAEMEEEINEALEDALQGGRVDVDYSSSLYVITSRATGNRSSVVVTDADSNNAADDLKIGTANSGVEVAGSKGLQLCVSDVAGKTSVGSAALGAAGYASCGATLPAATVLRQIASADLNCTGPVIGTLREVTQTAAPIPVKKYGTASSTTTGAAALVFAVKGVEAADDCVVTPVSLGTGPAYMKHAAVTADTITVTMDANQSGGTTVINYVCW